jgi:hypothetical protein
MRSSQEDVCMRVCIFRYREEIVSIMYWYKVLRGKRRRVCWVSVSIT